MCPLCDACATWKLSENCLNSWVRPAISNLAIRSFFIAKFYSSRQTWAQICIERILCCKPLNCNRKFLFLGVEKKKRLGVYYCRFKLLNTELIIFIRFLSCCDLILFPCLLKQQKTSGKNWKSFEYSSQI